jgi:hypothetical protein
MPMVVLTEQELQQLQAILWQSTGMPLPPAITQPLLQKLLEAYNPAAKVAKPAKAKGNADDSLDAQRSAAEGGLPSTDIEHGAGAAKRINVG